MSDEIAKKAPEVKEPAAPGHGSTIRNPHDFTPNEVDKATGRITWGVCRACLVNRRYAKIRHIDECPGKDHKHVVTDDPMYFPHCKFCGEARFDDGVLMVWTGSEWVKGSQ